jgi:hypothetical protein
MRLSDQAAMDAAARIPLRCADALLRRSAALIAAYALALQPMPHSRWSFR